MPGKIRIRKVAGKVGRRIAQSKSGRGVSYGARVLVGRQLTKKSMRKMDDTYFDGSGVPKIEKVGFLGRKRGFKSRQAGLPIETEIYHVKKSIRVKDLTGKKSGQITVNKTFDRKGRLAKKWTDANIVTRYKKRKK